MQQEGETWELDRTLKKITSAASMNVSNGLGIGERVFHIPAEHQTAFITIVLTSRAALMVRFLLMFMCPTHLLIADTFIVTSWITAMLR